MIIFIVTNFAFILATQIGNKADFVARLFLCFPVLGLVIRFVLSLFNKRTMPNKIPDDLGGLALMLPCYTEGEESLKPTIDSMVENVNNLPDSLMRCLFVVCDGRVQGKENDKMTCEIMKDILSPYDKVTEGVKYTSAWTGANTCDVASGWYEGLPYIQITKHENRGKRDSQLIMLTLLRWQSDPIIDVIKDHLRYLGLLEHGQQFPFQFLFATDSDTIIKPDSLDILMQGLTKKRNTVAVCGNVKILNKHKNLLTMSQVYEYFFSQFHTRGAESKIGRVTCLPGCFTLYKLYHKVTADMIHPYAIQDDVFFSYACQPSTTLHHMNLMLGEDRFLTSLMLKFMPWSRMYFIPAAECETIAPETCSVFISQRRRWNNTAFHNIFDLCFSPDHFLIRIYYGYDFMSNLLQPGIYFLFSKLLIMMLVSINDGVSTLDILNFIFGTILFVCTVTAIIKRQLYCLLYFLQFMAWSPMLYFFLPAYCIWHSDDLSWGKTRQVTEAAASDENGETPLLSLLAPVDEKKDDGDGDQGVQGSSGGMDKEGMDEEDNGSVEEKNSVHTIDNSFTNVTDQPSPDSKSVNSTDSLQGNSNDVSYQHSRSSAYSEDIVNCSDSISHRSDTSRSLSVVTDSSKPEPSSVASSEHDGRRMSFYDNILGPDNEILQHNLYLKDVLDMDLTEIIQDYQLQQLSANARKALESKRRVSAPAESFVETAGDDADDGPTKPLTRYYSCRSFKNETPRVSWNKQMRGRCFANDSGINSGLESSSRSNASSDVTHDDVTHDDVTHDEIQADCQMLKLQNGDEPNLYVENEKATYVGDVACLTPSGSSKVSIEEASIEEESFSGDNIAQDNRASCSTNSDEVFIDVSNVDTLSRSSFPESSSSGIDTMSSSDAADAIVEIDEDVLNEPPDIYFRTLQPKRKFPTVSNFYQRPTNVGTSNRSESSGEFETDYFFTRSKTLPARLRSKKKKMTGNVYIFNPTERTTKMPDIHRQSKNVRVLSYRSLNEDEL